ncbi:hypothetical protein FHS68_004031 [Dyadobacter arcticus]|uniref:Uncharacterized protein n=1 Tax=Dyadobacter arcticus TaxID=1078754 RepID=A0ABX0UPD9_9BACT|nr:hypothetical protein [Dyadobacter arcticus]
MIKIDFFVAINLFFVASIFSLYPKTEGYNNSNNMRVFFELINDKFASN